MRKDDTLPHRSALTGKKFPLLLHTHLAILTLILFTAPAFSLELPVTDDFSAAEKEGRRAVRGEWKIEDGVISCTQDPELFKQFHSHGPVMCTVNGEKIRHAFRVTLRPEAGTITTYFDKDDPKGE